MAQDTSTPWLRFTVEYLQNGSDGDTVNLTLSSLSNCVIGIAGAPNWAFVDLVYSHTEQDTDGQCFAVGVSTVTNEQVRVPLEYATVRVY